jgi:ribonuclease H2 subunit A
MEEIDSQDIILETPAKDVFTPPSVHPDQISQAASYTHHSAIPATITDDANTECVLGIDEAGRGPVLGKPILFLYNFDTAHNPRLQTGPMVYGLFYLPLSQHRSLLVDKYHFDDSKVLTADVRSKLMESLCTPSTDLFQTCGWATRVMSARDISSGMLQPGAYNLNAQAMDATIALIKEVLAQGINVKEIYVDTIGKPEIYQRKLERVFPAVAITVAKKADSLYPCVSAASVCAKVTRDAALEHAYKSYHSGGTSAEGWGSGYPSDARCVNWLKGNMDPLFGWGEECRFSWGTTKDLLDNKTLGHKVEWHNAEDALPVVRVTDYFTAEATEADSEELDELALWFGKPAKQALIS